MRGGLAGLVLALAGVLAPITTSAVARATNEVGVINVTWQFTYTYGCVGCGGVYVGSSTGHISGTDSNGTPYSLLWPNPAGTTGALTNLSMNIGTAIVCRPAPLGGSMSGSFSISGAVLVYGGVVYNNAAVSGNFGAVITGATMTSGVNGVSITGGPSTISIAAPLQSLGVLQMVPTTPVAAGCVLGTTQGFLVSGPILTLL
jgi:hypothetical protein